MQTLTFIISGMHCTSCAMNIDGELEDVQGVQEAKTNYAKQRTTVTFDPEKITPERILSIIRGLDDQYEVNIMEYNDV